MLQAELTTIITYNPWAITTETTCGELLDLLGDLTSQPWPVVDDRRRLAGMLSNADLVRAIQSQAVGDDSSSDWAKWRSRPIEDIMSRRFVSLEQPTSAASVVSLLLQHSVQSVPVLEDSRLIGLITTTDLLREFWYSESAIGRGSVLEIMQPAGDPIDCDATLDEATEMMRRANQQHLCVVRGDLPLGVVSPRDLLRASLRDTVAETFGDEFNVAGPRTVLELAAAAPTVRPGDRLSKAAGQMVEHDRQAIAITNQAGRLLGIVSEDAVLGQMIAEEVGSGAMPGVGSSATVDETVKY